jgi:hypothetical protein
MKKFEDQYVKGIRVQDDHDAHNALDCAIRQFLLNKTKEIERFYYDEEIGRQAKCKLRVESITQIQKECHYYLYFLITVNGTIVLSE